MGNEVIMLANPYKPKKLEFPVVMSEKIDGVAVDLHCTHPDIIGARTRQNKPSEAIQHIQTYLQDKLPHLHHLVCELHVEGLPFKEISGISRRSENDTRLVAHIYDYYVEGKADTEYEDRMRMMANNVGRYCSDDSPVRIIPAVRCANQEELDAAIETFTKNNPDAEGVVIRSLRGEDSFYKMGRSHGMMKLKNKGTIDLEVHSFEEAISKDTGLGLNMVGRINAHFFNKKTGETDVIGIGPGSMKHDERHAVWDMQSLYVGKIMEVDYMPDKTYDALREPRFKHWREDKDTPNQEEL